MTKSFIEIQDQKPYDAEHFEEATELMAMPID